MDTTIRPSKDNNGKSMSNCLVKLRSLSPGVYWYMVPGKPADICEKREGENFVRFTNGSQQSWLRDGESFIGPLISPSIAGVEMQSAFEAKYQRDWNDPAGDEMKAVWADAWAAARGATNLQSDWAAQEVEDRASESAAIRRAP